MATCFFCMAFFFVELLFYTWCRVQYTSVGYEITNANKTQRELTTLQNTLKIELEQLKSPERIEKIAKERIGLMPPTPEQMVTIQ